VNTERMPVKTLLAMRANYNPREITDEALEGLGASIERFGLVQPIIVNKRTDTIVGGNQRLLALEQLGESETEVIVVDLSPEEERALNLTLNNPAVQGSFTDDVEAIIQELQGAIPDAVDQLRLSKLTEEALEIVDFAPEVPEARSSRYRDKTGTDEYTKVDVGELALTLPNAVAVRLTEALEAEHNKSGRRVSETFTEIVERGLDEVCSG